MRLWHVDLLNYLPKGQLLSQWRELNSIFAKEDKHILINYIYEYPKNDLYIYAKKVIEEMKKRGYQIRSYEKMNKYFGDLESVKHVKPFKNHHDNEYLQICYYNLKEKFIRDQKDFEEDKYNNLCRYVNDILKNSIDGFK